MFNQDGKLESLMINIGKNDMNQMLSELPHKENIIRCYIQYLMQICNFKRMKNTSKVNV